MAVYTELTKDDFKKIIFDYFGDTAKLVSFEPISEGVSNTNYMVTLRYYTEEELKLIQEEMEKQIERATETAKKRGYKRNPRIEAANLK